MISNETLEKEMATTPVFWPGEFHGLYIPWGHEELVKTEQFSPRTSGLIFFALILTLVLDVVLIFVSYMPILPAVFYTPPKMLLTKLSAHVAPIPVSSSSFTDLGSSQFSSVVWIPHSTPYLQSVGQCLYSHSTYTKSQGLWD